MKEKFVAGLSPIAFDSSWESYGARCIRIAGKSDGIRFNIRIDERKLSGYALNKTLESLQQMVDTLRQNARHVEGDVVETCVATRITAI